MSEYIFAKEYWVGDSRDGMLVGGEGRHFFRMIPAGLIVEAYEVYENEEGVEVVTPLPEMKNVSWIDDFGFDDLRDLDRIEECEFARVKKRCTNPTQA